ncbi:hypothetical protein JCM10213_009127 [Rhodosporidiobolus nylandii]
MSFSDLTRSLTTFPPSPVAAPTSSSFTSSSAYPPSVYGSYSPTPVVPATTASLGSSNVPGSSIAALEASEAASRQGSGEKGGVDVGLAAGLGAGLGIAAVLATLAAVFVVHSRRAQKKSFDQRKEVIEERMREINEAGEAER